MSSSAMSPSGSLSPSASGGNRFDQMFAALRREGRKGLIVYLMAGDPRPEATPEIAGALVEAGCDALELGVPFSDPLADGPTIQAAGQRALAAGTRLVDVLRIARSLRARFPSLPLALMVYYNTVLQRGEAAFVREAAGAGVDALIVPDLPHEEGTGLRREAAACGVGLVPLIAPTSPIGRIREMLGGAPSGNGAHELHRACGGFAYLVSVRGVTGARDRLPEELPAFADRVRREASGRWPLAIGFGISGPETAREAARLADAVIVGSALIERLAGGAEGLAAAVELTRALRRAV